MSIGVRVNIKEDSAVLPALAKLALDRDDKTALLNEIGIHMSENTRLRFTDQHAPDGTPWIPSLRAIAEGGETLRDTGALMNSITHSVVGEDTVEWGTNVAYAQMMQEGGDIQAKTVPYLIFKVPGGGWARKKEVHIPGRPFLGMDAEDEQLVVDIIGQFLVTGKGRK